MSWLGCKLSEQVPRVLVLLLFLGSAPLLMAEANSWAVGGSIGRVGPWQQQSLLAFKILDPDKLWTNRLGRASYRFWHGREGEVYRFWLQSVEVTSALRYLPVNGFPLYGECGSGVAVVRGRSEVVSQDHRSDQLGFTGVSPFVALGFEWRWQRRLIIDWQWTHLSRTRILARTPGINSGAQVAVLDRWAQQPRWFGIGNLSVGWLF